MKKLSTEFFNRHNDIRKILNDIDRIRNEASDERRILLTQLKKVLDAHLSAEELVLYRTLDDLGDEEISLMAARGREDHELFNFLYDRLMKDVWPNSKNWTAIFQSLRDNIEIYLHREESRLLPMSDRVLPQNQIKDLIGRIEKTESDWITTH